MTGNVQDNALFQLTGVGVVETDLQTGRFVRVNRAFCEMVGFSEAELLGMTNAELTHPDDWSRDAATFEAMQRGERREVAELTRVRHKDGHTVWLELSVTVLGEGDGKVNLAVVNDVTERQQTDAALREAKEQQAFLLKLSDALRPLSDSLAIQETACRVLGEHLGANRVLYAETAEGLGAPALVRAVDYTNGVPSRVGRHRLDDYGTFTTETWRAGRNLLWSSLDDLPDLPADERAAYEAVEIEAIIGVPLVKEGRFIAFLAAHQAAPRNWTANEIALVEETVERTWAAAERARAEAALRDLNETLEKKVAERTDELARSQRRFSQAFHVGPVAASISTLDASGTDRETFLEVNDEFTKLTGYAREEVVSKNARELGMWSSKEDQRTLERANAQEGEFHNLELHLRTKTGEVKDVLLSGAVIRIDGHHGLLKLFYDVTERKRTERQLVQAIGEVMNDTAWFSQSVLERFARLRGDGDAGMETVDLTARERQILERIAQGKNNTAIAEELELKTQTVRNYVTNIYDKLGVNSRAEAVVWARERGLAGF